MALRASTMACAAASKPPTGLIGVLASLKERLATGKLLRPDVADDVLRLPMEQSKYRTPAPGYVWRFCVGAWRWVGVGARGEGRPRGLARGARVGSPGLARHALAGGPLL